MRKILPILLGVSLFLTPLYPVYAQNTASSPAFAKRPKALELKGEILEKRGEALKALEKDKIASRAAVLKGKLAKFKDKAKAIRVENINNNLNTVNKRRTDSMSQVLEKISKILERLKAKSGAAATAGKDVSALNSAIADVEVKWAEADSALKAQMETDYSLAVNTESTVKEDAKITRNALHTDLKSVHTQIVEVRQSLAKAIQTAMDSLKGGFSGTQ